MNKDVFDKKDIDISWCPGCGNFKILDMLKQTFAELDIPPNKLVVASGIGQAPKTPQYFNTNMFNGLHGRALSSATGIQAANPELTVVAQGGDGDMYGEGGNHFLHTIRRNPDIVHIVHNNMVYGLTKGQASPTSAVGFTTSVQVDGVHEEPVNPIAVAIAQNASFVSRAFCGHVEETKEILKQAIAHKGYALVDLLQNCVTFNKTNTFKWFKDMTYYVEDSYDPSDRAAAFARATENEKLALGVLYRRKTPPAPFHTHLHPHAAGETPLYRHRYEKAKMDALLDGSYR
ncbi:thiamine pyrophosphate-dependent enzyme [Chitinivibrio alkaliphilus]|uniref:2-oxoglutarate:ferredoxin oxidoreductase, bets subunit n=1 Tax=Chitinivibrio alkaliphilus ACht1 TaxID=1313304 RepID=U7D378_9BACT|nr:thiamine pyrophosphate-dependent enzyme [Chitinivibrio alkaliphilus]ERP30959.1 2-oxoglutarate:ferredoxin oxidoreductase, bets subunit [Chitinivibrio alkaliphilus ACht1]